MPQYSENVNGVYDVVRIEKHIYIYKYIYRYEACQRIELIIDNDSLYIFILAMCILCEI